MRMRARRRWLALVMGALLLLPLSALADPDPSFTDLTKQRQDLEQNRTQNAGATEATVSQIFNLNRTLDGIRKEIADLNVTIADVGRQEQAATDERDRLAAKQKLRQGQFARRLRYYQEQGTFAPIGFLLQSGSFVDFLFRVDVLGRVLEQDANLIKELKGLKVAVQEQATLLAARRAELASLHERQAAKADQLGREIAQKEALLAGLKDQRGTIEAKVGDLERVWSQSAKPVLMTFGQRLQTVALKVGDLTPDAVQLTLVPPGVTVRVQEETMNRFIRQDGGLQGLQLHFLKDQANIDGAFEGVAVQILGRFVLIGKTVLRYEPQTIRLQGFPLPDSVRQELLAQGRLDIDFADLVGKWSVKELRMEDGAMILKAGLK